MAYVGILLVAILVSFVIVRIAAFALHLTGMEYDIAKFQALSAFTVVRYRDRRRIITLLIIFGNAGLVTVIATLVASFTQVSGYSWFFIRLAIIIAAVFILYQLILRSGVGNWIARRLRKPLQRYVQRGAPAVEMIFQVSQDRNVYLVRTHGKSRIVGLSVAEARTAEDVKILAIYRMAGLLAKPGDDEKIAAGDRLLAYGDTKTLKRLLSRGANTKANE
jgi:hypothetical protein